MVRQGATGAPEPADISYCIFLSTSRPLQPRVAV